MITKREKSDPARGICNIYSRLSHSEEDIFYEDKYLRRWKK
jgi:hypothetical protein